MTGAGRPRASGASDAARPFTGRLTPAGAGLLRRAGLVPLALVMGNCVLQPLPPRTLDSSDERGEITGLTAGHAEATGRALERLRRHAQALGASGVVDLRYEAAPSDWAPAAAGALEVRLIGTAVRWMQPAGALPDTPWLSGLSAPDWWALHSAGYEPAAFVYGHSARCVMASALDAWADSGRRSAELRDSSRAVSACRHAAAQRLREQAQAAGATGVLGVSLAWGRGVIDLTDRSGGFVASGRRYVLLTLTGTAIRAGRRTPPSDHPPRLVLPIRPIASAVRPR